MRKRDELEDLSSCLARADADEMIFVLLGRDAAAPATVRFWVEERIRLGKNQPRDRQLLDALRVASTMERERSTPRPVAPDAGDVET
jgi:hypothetical protein